MTKEKKKKKRKPLLPKVNIDANMPPPGPLKWIKPSLVLEQARNMPIFGCWVMSGWQEEGLSPVVVARQQSLERVVFATILVDFYLLGVKDAFWKADIPLKQFQRKLSEMLMGEPEPCSVELAHEIVYGSINYAERYGFQPHHDFTQASLILDPPDAHPQWNGVKFGRDGKPLYVSGPHDNVQMILSRLDRTAGKGNYDVLLGFDDDID